MDRNNNDDDRNKKGRLWKAIRENTREMTKKERNTQTHIQRERERRRQAKITRPTAKLTCPTLASPAIADTKQVKNKTGIATTAKIHI